MLLAIGLVRTYSGSAGEKGGTRGGPGGVFHHGRGRTQGAAFVGVISLVLFPCASAAKEEENAGRGDSEEAEDGDNGDGPMREATV